MFSSEKQITLKLNKIGLEEKTNIGKRQSGIYPNGMILD
jgi:hypothetical protein